MLACLSISVFAQKERCHSKRAAVRRKRRRSRIWMKWKHRKSTNIAKLAGFSYYDSLQPKDNTSKHSWSVPWRNVRIGHMSKTYTNICSRSIRFQALQAGLPCWRSCNNNKGMRSSRPSSLNSSIHSSHIHPDHILCVHPINITKYQISLYSTDKQ